MTPAARRRLASLLTEQPRRFRIRATTTTLSPAHFVALSPGSMVHWLRDGRFLIGIATTDGRSVAAIGRDINGKAVAMGTGSDRAKAALIRLLERAEHGRARGFDAVLAAEGKDELRITCSWDRVQARVETGERMRHSASG